MSNSCREFGSATREVAHREHGACTKILSLGLGVCLIHAASSVVLPQRLYTGKFEPSTKVFSLGPGVLVIHATSSAVQGEVAHREI